VTESDIKTAFDRHKDAVYSFAWRMTGSADIALDVTQDVFLTLLRAPDRFDPVRGALRSFLLGVARNLALTRLHKESRWSVLNEYQPFVEQIEVGEAREMVGRAVAALPPLQREVLILAQYEELSLEEIAMAVHTEVGTVKSRLFRARENLRRMLAPLKPSRSVSCGTTE
jgi:RNA polymerase sigma-70 factor (ECF subfamily)